MTGKKCTITLEGGNPCGAYALTGKEFCFTHDPESKREKALAVSKGGVMKRKRDTMELPDNLRDMRLDNPNDILILLATTIKEVRGGEIDPRTAVAIGNLSGHMLKAFEVLGLGKKMKEILSVLEDRRG